MSTTPVLVINAGSSSVKYQLVDVETEEVLAKGLIERIGEPESTSTHSHAGDKHTSTTPVPDHAAALERLSRSFSNYGPDLDEIGLVAVGHRVVHGGSTFTEAALVDDHVLEDLRALSSLAPLHNPANIEGIEVAMKQFPHTPQVVVCDTAFHQSMPEAGYTYAVPLHWRDDLAVRRYGAHGTSYSYVTRRAAAVLGVGVEDADLVVLHLGNGASAAAISAGRSIDTSMGITPLEGLVMGTRSGDIDPSIYPYLVKSGMSVSEIDTALNRESGLKGLTGTNDFRELEDMLAAENRTGQLAFDIVAHRLKKYIGGYAALLGRVDAIVFTAGVGENSPLLRSAVCSNLGFMGVQLDHGLNDAQSRKERFISTVTSRVAVLVIPTNEELEIARQAVALVRPEAS